MCYNIIYLKQLYNKSNSCYMVVVRVILNMTSASKGKVWCTSIHAVSVDFAFFLSRCLLVASLSNVSLCFHLYFHNHVLCTSYMMHLSQRFSSCGHCVLLVLSVCVHVLKSIIKILFKKGNSSVTALETTNLYVIFSVGRADQCWQTVCHGSLHPLNHILSQTLSSCFSSSFCSRSFMLRSLQVILRLHTSDLKLTPATRPAARDLMNTGRGVQTSVEIKTSFQLWLFTCKVWYYRL